MKSQSCGLGSTSNSRLQGFASNIMPMTLFPLINLSKMRAVGLYRHDIPAVCGQLQTAVYNVSSRF